MIDRKIDSFITTSNGINTHTYTGNELGKKAFVAKTSNVESIPHTVIDGIWADRGTSSDHNDVWAYSNCTSAVMDRQSDGTKIDVSEVSASGNKLVIPTTTNSYQNYIQNNFALEFEIISRDTKRLKFVNSARNTDDGTKYPSLELQQFTVPFRVKLLMKQSSTEFYVNDELFYELEYTNAQYHRPYFEFTDGDYGKWFKFKNMVLYPI